MLIAFVNAADVVADTSLKSQFYYNGNLIDEREIGPGLPPAGWVKNANAPDLTAVSMSSIDAADVPALDWSYGCSATSATMLFGYYDRNGYPNMYTGPTDGGVFPLTNAVWGSGECPLSASHKGIDSRTINGSVDDYYYYYLSTVDPYYMNWTQHSPLDSVGDYMGTNQYINWHNSDGSTTFYFNTDGSALYDYSGSESASPPRRDGAHGMKLFAQSRGYTVTSVYNQYINPYKTSGFTFAQYKSEIDAGNPVLIQLSGHTMLGVGYSGTNTIIVHDTWDYSSHTMTWGGTYSGMTHYGVTVLHLSGGIPTYSVTYNGNGGSGAVPTDSNTYHTGDLVTLKPNGTLYRNGYTFNGWNLSSTTGLPYAADSTYTMGTSNAVFYANWSLIPTYSVTYSANGGTGAVPTDSNTYATGAPVTVKTNGTLYRNGYTFNGWNLTSTTGLPYAAGSTYTMGTSNAVFYANWSLIPPIINDISPTGGSITGGTPVTIAGTGFLGTSWVKFGSTYATIQTVSDTEITVLSPGAASSGTITVTVNAPGGTAAGSYTYGGVSVTDISPTGGSITGGTPVTITGTGFLGTSWVKFGSTYATIQTVSDTEITVLSPGTASSGTVTVTINAPGGTAAGSYTYGGVSVTDISPTGGPVTGGTPVTITGTGFLGTLSVQFGSTYATIQTVSDTEITVLSPGHPSGTVDVTVTTTTGTTATSSADLYEYI